jgi:hypothetical protein
MARINPIAMKAKHDVCVQLPCHIMSCHVQIVSISNPHCIHSVWNYISCHNIRINRILCCLQHMVDDVLGQSMALMMQLEHASSTRTKPPLTSNYQPPLRHDIV